MYMHRPVLGVCLLLWWAAAAGESPELGQDLSEAEVAALDFAIMPDGEGLPPGSGNAAVGAALYKTHCSSCHGEEGRGGLHDPLAGGMGTIAEPVPEKTVGSYWPYATTLFDYMRRAMPYQSPGSMTNDELYSITAYVLYLNGIVGESDSLDAGSLPKVQMPNRDNFIRKFEP